MPNRISAAERLRYAWAARNAAGATQEYGAQRTPKHADIPIGIFIEDESPKGLED